MHTRKISANAVVDRSDDSVEEDFEPEVIPESDVTSLQIASGIHPFGDGLGMTMMLLEIYLHGVLGEAWRRVRSSLDLEDLWVIAQVDLATNAMERSNLNHLEQLFEETFADWGFDPVSAAKLLTKLRTWDLTTRWAVLRAVGNSLEVAMLRAANRRVIPHRLIKDELRKLLAAASK